MNEPANDLASLTAGAHRETQRQSKAPAPKEPLLGARGKNILAGGVAAATLVVAYVYAGPYWLGYSDHTLRKELGAVVAAAREDVEAARRKQGSLPSSIPNAALAMIVEYHRSGDGYRLVGSDGERVVEMDQAGTITESRKR